MDIADWRKQIDDIDERLVALLNERATVAREIGALKDSNKAPIYEPEREKEIFANVRKFNRGPLPDSDLVHIYERLIGVMRKIQQAANEPPTSRVARVGRAANLDVKASD